MKRMKNQKFGRRMPRVMSGCILQTRSGVECSRRREHARACKPVILITADSSKVAICCSVIWVI